MMNENLLHYKPTTEQYDKFTRINNWSDEKQNQECLYVNDCSICPMAIHQYLLSTTKHTCVQGMTIKEFEIAMDNSDCEF